MIDELDIRRIRDAANVVDVISDYVQLKKVGSEYQCLCPFHADRHMGSFSVSPRKNMYYCFSCGKGGDSITWLMDYAGMTYLEAVRYLGAKYGIEVEGSKDYHPTPCKPHTPLPPLPMYTVDAGMVNKRRDLSGDTLCNWLRRLPWNSIQRSRLEKVLNNYLVGHSKFGHTIFWQVDEHGHVRTGKMMAYKPDGHRDRDSKGNFSWIHKQLEKAGLYDPDKADIHTTFFGMHLLDAYPNATVNIVESEKTALICAIYFANQGNDIWMASGGLSMLTRERLKPIIERGRKVSLYPDHDGIAKWTKTAGEIGYELLKVQSTFIERNWKPDDGEKADLADIIVRLMTESRAGKTQRVAAVIEDMKAKNPWFGTLISEFGLSPVIEAGA